MTDRGQETYRSHEGSDDTDATSRALVSSPARAGKLAIVAFCETTRNLAPFTDPSFAIFGCNHLWPQLPKRADGNPAWDAWIDIHTPEWSAVHLKPWAEHEAWLRTDHGSGRTIYMQQAYPQYPNAKAYPIERVLDTFGRKYFTSAISYQIALGLLEGFREIHLYGIDLRHDTEYGMQRPCAEYWCGRAEGMGVKLYVPPQAAILSSEALYGFEEQTGAWAEMDRALVEELANGRNNYEAAARRNDQAVTEMQTHHGVVQLAEALLGRVRQRARGGVL